MEFINEFKIHNGRTLEYYGDDEIVTIPDGVRIIGSYTFGRNEFVKKVNIPSSVEEIDSYAFNDCKNLSKVIFSEGLKTIKSSAFDNCKITAVEIPESVECIEQNAFYDCPIKKFVCKNKNYVDFNEPIGGYDISVKCYDKDGFFIVNNVLVKCGSEKSKVIVPSGVTRIGKHAFRYDYTQNPPKEIIIPDTVEYIDDSAFCDEHFEVISIPENTKLGKNVFSGCIDLKTDDNGYLIINNHFIKYPMDQEKIVVPEGITHISTRDWRSNNQVIKELIIPEGVTHIEAESFSNAISLAKVVLPSTIEYIDSKAFSGCANLRDINLHANIILGQNVFDGCQSLNDETFKLLQKLEVIEDLYDYNWQTKLYENIDKEIATISIVKYEGNDADVIIQNGIENIGENAFREGFERYRNYRTEGSLNSVKLSASVKSIDIAAFYGCTELKSIALNEGLEYIAHNAFADCIKLKSINIPSTVKYIAPSAFENTCLESITVDPENKYFCVQEGVLYSKDKTMLVHYPGGLKEKSFVIPGFVKKLCDRAFYSNEYIKEIEIPENVEYIGNYIFSSGYSDCRLKKIIVHPNAGSKFIGRRVLGFYSYNAEKLVYPQLPPEFESESNVQLGLVFGFLENQDMYSDEYKKLYIDFIKRKEKTILNKAKMQDYKNMPKLIDELLSDSSNVVEEQLSPIEKGLTNKKLNQIEKIDLLELAVMTGTIEDVQRVCEHCKSFELSARALGIAARFRGLDFVKELVKYGAKFSYPLNGRLNGYYHLYQETVSRYYPTRFEFMLIPEKIDEKHTDEYTFGNGLDNIYDFDEYNLTVLPYSERVEIAKWLICDKLRAGIMPHQMLYFSLVTGEVDFADALVEMGVDLVIPRHAPNYINIISGKQIDGDWNDHTYSMCLMEADYIAPSLERFVALMDKHGKKMKFTQGMFDGMHWDDDALAFALKNVDYGKVNQKRLMEFAVEKGFVESLEAMGEIGWLSANSKVKKLIDFAQSKKNTNIVTWLLEYQNNNFDLNKEAEKEEKKMLQEIMEDPNSVSALKKIWSYKKLDDGTLIITSYKGKDADVVVPAKIGKSVVTEIGESAFEVTDWGSAYRYKESRSKIKSVLLPEGIKKIGKDAFSCCRNLEDVKIPTTLKSIEKKAFGGCEKLNVIDLSFVKNIDKSAFAYCKKFYKNDMLIINGCLCHCKNIGKELVIPDEVTIICSEINGFYLYSSDYVKGCKSIVMNDNVKSIYAGAFEYFCDLETIVLSNNLKVLNKNLLYRHAKIKELFIPASIKKIEQDAIGESYVVVADDNKYYSSVDGVLFNKDKTILLHYPAFKEDIYFIPDGTKALAKKSFKAVPKELYIPNSVVEIEEGAFSVWNYMPLIHCESGSFAEKYAIANNLKHIIE